MTKKEKTFDTILHEDETRYKIRIKLIELKCKRDMASETILYLTSIINGLENKLEKEDKNEHNSIS